ncbi:hypothetical protein FKP32DRAFT_1614339 [Trametes sanguinea]|nr:hypothetical protein FKP32DRAFT_1614339 [Trametes sanguinea]
MLVWIKGCPSPQVVRDRLLSDDAFETQLLGWLEACHVGDFATADDATLAAQLEEEYYERRGEDDWVKRSRLKSGITDPARTLPRRPPTGGDDGVMQRWHQEFLGETDRVVFCSNRHDRDHTKGCWCGYCRARFPRQLFETTEVDRSTGAIRFAKKEEWINTYNPVLSHVLRCNSDVTCLLSGTQVKAIIAYVTDYVTKSSLTTHSFFNTEQANWGDLWSVRTC